MFTGKSKDLLISNKLCSSKKNFTSEQYKLFYQILHSYKWTLEKDSAVKILNFSQNEIVEMLGKNKLRFKQIKEIIKEMPHYFSVFNSSTEEVIFIFDKINLKEMGVDGFNGIEFVFNKSIDEYITDLVDCFSCVNLHEIKLLKRKYSIRLYELCCQFSNQKNYLMPYNNLKSFFEIPSSYISSDIDKLFNSIEKEVNIKTRFNVSTEKIKKVGKITHYNFTITKKNNSNGKTKVSTVEDLEQIDVNDVNNTNQLVSKSQIEQHFENIWKLYPLKKGKANITFEDKKKLSKYSFKVLENCINRYMDYIAEREKEGFNLPYMHGDKFFTKGFEDYLDDNYQEYEAKYIKTTANKPIQTRNYEQRIYDDDYYDSLYDN